MLNIKELNFFIIIVIDHNTNHFYLIVKKFTILILICNI
jgi:hypothetical protein